MDSLKPRILRIIPIIAFLFSLTSCEEDLSTGMALKGDYFPLEQGQLNNYKVELYNTALPTQWLFTDTTRLINRRDTFIEGKEYLEIVRYYDKPLPADHDVKFYDPYKYVRRAGSQYFIKFAMLYIADEIMFLDTEKNPGDSWIQYRFLDNIKIIYTIEAVNAQKVVDGKIYKNVIEVKEENHVKDNEGNYSLRSTVWRAYAKDVGEIYAYEKYSSELVYVANSKTFLLRK